MPVIWRLLSSDGGGVKVTHDRTVCRPRGVGAGRQGVDVRNGATAPAAPGWGDPQPPAAGLGGRVDSERAFGVPGQPGLRGDDGGVEPREAAAEILLDKIVGAGWVVLPAVLEDIAERVLDLGGRLQNAQVIAVGENPPFASEDAVDRAGDANGEGVQGARERFAVGRLDDEVEVVALHAEVTEAAAEGLAALVEGAPNRTERGGATRAREAPHPAIGHVDGEARGKLGRRLCETRRPPGPGLRPGLRRFGGRRLRARNENASCGDAREFMR